MHYSKYELSLMFIAFMGILTSTLQFLTLDMTLVFLLVLIKSFISKQIFSNSVTDCSSGTSNSVTDCSSGTSNGSSSGVNIIYAGCNIVLKSLISSSRLNWLTCLITLLFNKVSIWICDLFFLDYVDSASLDIFCIIILESIIFAALSYDIETLTTAFIPYSFSIISNIVFGIYFTSWIDECFI